MKKFAVFAFYNYYPGGGVSDFVGFYTIKGIQKVLKKPGE